MALSSISLHKKDNFFPSLVKEIDVGGGNGFDRADKITASDFHEKKTGEKTSSVESHPEVALSKPVFNEEAVKKKLSEIFDEI